MPERWLDDEPWSVGHHVLDTGHVHVFVAQGWVYETPGIYVAAWRWYGPWRLRRAERRMARRAAKLNERRSFADSVRRDMERMG